MQEFGATCLRTLTAPVEQLVPSVEKLSPTIEIVGGVQELILRTDTGYLCTVCNKVIRHMGSCTRHVKEKHLGIARNQAIVQASGGLML